MFRKIVANLPFSPALVGQLGFYARRLRKEEATRKAGLIMTALALVVQSFAVFSPPEAANASSTADFIPGGVRSKDDLLKHYDANTGKLKSTLNSLGITRAEVKSLSRTTIGEAGHYNWSRTSLYSYAQGQRSWNYGGGTVYYRPMTLTAGAKTSHAVFAGKSATFGWFAIKIDCGNLITSKPPSPPPAPVAKCRDLEATVSNQRVTLTGKAKVKNKAKIKAYVFDVTNANSVAVYHNKVQTGKESQSVTFTLAPGNYAATLKVKTSEGDKGGPDCKTTFTVTPPPVKETPQAICTNLNATIANRTILQLSGTAAVSGGATISKYTFTVKNKEGAVIAVRSVDTKAQSAVAEDVTVKSPGDYTAELTVSTSIGNVTDNPGDCVKPFTVTPPEMCQYNPSLPVDHPDCQPCPDNPNIWVKDERCSSDIINTKTAANMSQGNVNATTKIAKSGDKIAYTITSENRGLVAEKITMKESLKDVLEYTTLIDDGGGTFNKKQQTLTWPDISLKPGVKESRTFVVQIMEKIPLTNTGKSDQDSYDCKMVNTYGNSTGIKVGCSPEKAIVEQVATELPTTGPGENMLFAGGLLAIVAFFYARSRQLGKEVRLIRRNAHAGAF
ncbi:MAG TPA: hypothetical protein VGE13_01450 [Candidatus Saccharimonadales bacterium]